MEFIPPINALCIYTGTHLSRGKSRHFNPAVDKRQAIRALLGDRKPGERSLDLPSKYHICIYIYLLYVYNVSLI